MTRLEFFVVLYTVVTATTYNYIYACTLKKHNDHYTK